MNPYYYSGWKYLDLSGIYCKLILVAICGIAFVWFARKAARKSDAESLSFSRAQKIAGNILIGLGAFCMSGVLTYILSPGMLTDLVKSGGPMLGDDGIVRNTDVPLIWGYCTQIQHAFFSMCNSSFLYIALGFYVKNFQKNRLPIWKKICKVIGYILLTGVFLTCSDFHYFDIWEFLPKISFLLLAILFLRLGSARRKDREPEYLKETSLKEAPSGIIVKTDIEL